LPGLKDRTALSVNNSIPLRLLLNGPDDASISRSLYFFRHYTRKKFIELIFHKW
jgi:hypothetical protein